MLKKYPKTDNDKITGTLPKLYQNIIFQLLNE